MKNWAMAGILVGTLVAMIVSRLPATLAAAQPGVDLARLEEWDIVLPDDAMATEVYAAEEFQTLFAEAAGATLPVVRRTTRPDRHVFIGAGAEMQASNVGFSVAELGPEDLRVVVGEANIALAGGRPRGTLWAVYSFLEDYLGVRFLTPDHTHVPAVGKTLVVKAVDWLYRPPFAKYRGVGYGSPGDSVFAIRQRANNLYGDSKFGFGTPFCSPYINIGHSFYRQVPLEKYAKDHPEYYGLWDGRRRNDAVHTHLCLTNRDLVPIVTKAVFTTIEDPASIGRANFAVSQNDTIWQYCQDDNCMAVDRREGTHMGALLQFVNAVADRVAEKYPDVNIGTLAYGFSRKPPRLTKPRPNVEINLSSIEACQLHSLDDPDCPLNVEFRQDLEGWSRISEHLSAWTYNINFNDQLLPYPNLQTIKPNIQLLIAAGVEGAFMQCTGMPAAEMSDLRRYLLSRLMWNPDLDDQRIIDEFLTLHYGKAAGPIRQFIELVHRHYQQAGIHQSSCIKARWDLPVDESVARQSMELFAEAIKVAETDVIKQRVEKASICALRAAIEPVWDLQEDDSVDPAAARRLRPLVRQFLQLCDKYGMGRGVAGPRQRLADFLQHSGETK